MARFEHRDAQHNASPFHEQAQTQSQSTNAAHLARIRENQRRSRARRKEYMQDLEEKFRKCEQWGIEASSEMQAAARRVLEENQRLRIILKSKGLSDDEIDAVSNAEVKVATPNTTSDAVQGLESMIGTRRPCCSKQERPPSLHDIQESPSNGSSTHRRSGLTPMHGRETTARSLPNTDAPQAESHLNFGPKSLPQAVVQPTPNTIHSATARTNTTSAGTLPRVGTETSSMLPQTSPASQASYATSPTYLQNLSAVPPPGDLFNFGYPSHFPPPAFPPSGETFSDWSSAIHSNQSFVPQDVPLPFEPWFGSLDTSELLSTDMQAQLTAALDGSGQQSVKQEESRAQRSNGYVDAWTMEEA